MDETQWRWYKWTARNAQHLPVAILGAGFGATIIVFVYGIVPVGCTIPISLAAIPAVIGWSLGVMSTRAMDRHTDSRKINRKRRLVHLKVGRLMAALQAMQRFLDMHEILWESSKLQGVADAPGIVGPLRELFLAMQDIAEDRPDFDEIVEKDRDLYYAHLILRCYASTKSFGEDDRHIVEKAFQAFKNDRCNRTLKDLEKAYMHFAKASTPDMEEA